MSIKVKLNNVLVRIKCFYLKPLVNSESRSAKSTALEIKEYVEDNDIKVIFYDRIPAHYSFTRGVVSELIKNQKVILVAGDRNHPLINGDHPKGFKVFFLEKEYEYFLGKISCKVLITFASNFSSIIKPTKMIIVHMFHSLVSLHYIYDDFEFDVYDVFFACGPHHKREIEKITAVRGWEPRRVYEVGYNKVDQLIHCNSAYRDTEVRPVIVLAPSWGKNNLLRLCGKDIVTIILKHNFKVIVRPHPHSVEFDTDVISELQNISDRFPDLCKLELGAMGNESLKDSDIMISDWSGVAFEYAFGTGNPVIFIDIPRKINSKELFKINLPAMEDICRSAVGKIATLQNFEETMLSMLENHAQWRERIKNTEKEYLYNYGNSTNIAVKAIQELTSTS